LKDHRLYLFDIDGTLINTGGAGSQAMRRAFTALWRLEDGFARVEFSGRTDRAILRDALAHTACSENPFLHDLRRFKPAYFRRLSQTLEECNGTVLHGVIELLDLLKEDEGATVALATGNFRRSAGMKLRYYGIEDYFCAGGFGDRAENREDMLEQALRACQPFGTYDTVFVIGDTVYDVACAKAHGVMAVGVATGPVDAATLKAAGADIVLEDLSQAPGRLLS
jgi:HAD superfamily hydrolase (TIGR01549 family)